MAALRAGIKTVIIPDENAKDLTEIPDELKNALDILPVSRMDEVLKIAFTRPPQPIAWEEEGVAEAQVVPPRTRPIPASPPIRGRKPRVVADLPHLRGPALSPESDHFC